MLLLSFAGCFEQRIEWTEDVHFSEALTVTAATYARLEGRRAAEEVDRLAIYRLGEGDARKASVAALRDTKPLLETESPSSILAVLGAAEKRSEQKDECLGDRSGPLFFVVAYDSSRMRVGSFRSRFCKTADGLFATVRPTGGAAIYTSKHLAGEIARIAPVD